MKIYDKLVENTSMVLQGMIAFSKVTHLIVVAMFDISAELLTWGRLATKCSILVAVIAGEMTLFCANSQRWLSIDILDPELSRCILKGALLYLVIVLYLRAHSLLIWDSVRKLLGRR